MEDERIPQVHDACVVHLCQFVDPLCPIKPGFDHMGWYVEYSAAIGGAGEYASYAGLGQ